MYDNNRSKQEKELDLNVKADVVAKYKHNEIEEYYFQGDGFFIYVSYFVQTREYVAIEIAYNGDVLKFTIIDGFKETEYYKILQAGQEIELELILNTMKFTQKLWDDFITYTFVRLYYLHMPINQHRMSIEEREDYVPTIGDTPHVSPIEEEC